MWDDKPGAEFKKLNCNDNTEDKYVEKGNTGDLENASKEVYKHKQTITKKDIHAVSLQKSKVANRANSDSFIKSCKCYGKGTNRVNVQVKTNLAINVTK